MSDQPVRCKVRTPCRNIEHTPCERLAEVKNSHSDDRKPTTLALVTVDEPDPLEPFQKLKSTLEQIKDWVLWRFTPK